MRGGESGLASGDEAVTATIHHGEALVWLRSLATASADALVTDPPAGIGFMGKGWDRDRGGRTAWIAWLAEILGECRRVMKPGAAGWVWALPRTSHWTATACEDAGFEVRDILTHVQGQGFPKSKALLKPGSEHWILVRAPGPLRDLRIDECRVGVEAQDLAQMTGRSGKSTPNQVWGNGIGHHGTWEPKAAGRWPANAVFSHSGQCELRGVRRVKGGPAPYVRSADADGGVYGAGCGDKPAGYLTNGYADPDGKEAVADWACAEDCAIRRLEAQSGNLHGAGRARNAKREAARTGLFDMAGDGHRFGDTGTAARFFHCFPADVDPFIYQAKPGRRERNQGCDGLPERSAAELTGRKAGSAGLGMKVLPKGGSNPYAGAGGQPRANTHPTVKSVALMRHLCRLVTPPGGLVLDPFAGSGTTGVAALQEGLRFAGCEREAEYVEIARARVAHAAPRPLPTQVSQP